jgi:hypothetical protein
MFHDIYVQISYIIYLISSFRLHNNDATNSDYC